MKRATLYLLFILIVSGILFVGCSNDESTPIPTIETDAVDVTNGYSHVIIDVDAPSDIRLHTRRNVTLDYDHSDVSLFVVKEGEHQYISHSFSKSLDAIKLPFTVKVGINIEGDESESGLHKDMYISFRRFVASPTPSDVSYARAIGKGTRPWGDIGNVTVPILDFNSIYPNLEITENITNKSISFETSGERYTSSLEKIAANAGLSGTVPVKGLLLSGSASYGHNKSETKSNHYEYYMGYYGKYMSDIKLNTDWLVDNTKIALLDTTVNNVLNNPQSQSYQKYPNDQKGIRALLDNYGTHVITKAVFGGNYTTLYAREENAYETSVGNDAAVAITATTPLQSTNSWAKIYCQMTSSQALNANASGSNYSEEYNSASKGFCIITAKGGNASKDIEKWDASLTSDSKNTWVPISYLPEGTEENDNGLIKLTEFCIEESRVKALETYFESYYNEHLDTLTEAPMIIVDFMMKTGSNNHVTGEPKSFVAKDPKGIYRIYYPMMANSHAPIDEGYAIETSQSDYIVATDHLDHYWYYALGHLDKDAGVYGITDIILDNKDHDGYIQRGNHTDSEIDGALDNNYVQLKYASKETAEDKIITGIGLKRTGDDGNGKIIASTGGTEMVYPWGTDDSRFNKYWGEDSGYKWNDYKWFKGGLVFNCNFYPAFTTKPLDVNFSFGDLNKSGQISHPRKWGE